MKCPALRFAVAALLLSGLPSTAAASTDWYVGLGTGLGWAQLYAEDFNTNGCTNPCTESKQELDAGFKGFVGYQINRNWAFEVSWTGVGAFHYKTHDGTVTQDAKYQVKGAGYSFLPTLPLSRNLSLFGRLGGFASQTRLTTYNNGVAASAGVQSNRYTVLAGFGAQYFFNEGSGLRVEYENFGTLGTACGSGATCTGTGRAIVSMISASLVFPF